MPSTMGDFSPTLVADFEDEKQTLALTLLTDSSRIGRDAGAGFVQHATGVMTRLVKAIPMSNSSASFVAVCVALQYAVGTDIMPADQIDVSGRLYVVEETDEGLTGASVLTVYATRSRAAITW